MKISKILSCVAALAGFALGVASIRAADVVVAAGSSAAPVEFALRKMAAVLAARGDVLKRQDSVSPGAALVLRLDGHELAADGFKLERKGATLVVTGADARGAMYGLLDVAEQLRLGTALNAIAPREVRASFSLRAIKFNLPFSAYRNGAYLEQHQATS